MKFGKVGLIGRFKPLHKGAAIMLESVCENSEQLIIGIGSCNKYNSRNPFTAEESEEMIKLTLKNYANYKVIHIPDFAHIPEYADGGKWREYVKEKFGNLDYFVTANPYVAELLQDSYKILHPSLIIPKRKHVKLKATQVRLEMALGDSWKTQVSEEVADYLEKNQIIERFRKEFGLKTIADLIQNKINLKENAIEEKNYAGETR
ncbi:MAG: hypothetical protein ABIH72_05060 [archaeon]